jgi:sulfonate transport system substrate-binding protein
MRYLNTKPPLALVPIKWATAAVVAAALAAPAAAAAASTASAAQQAIPTVIPAGTSLVIADQNEALQTLMIASGEQARLKAKATYANFLGGPSILEAFRAGALDLAVVGNAPPIQAQAAGNTLPIVAARRNTGPDYRFALRPGIGVSSLKDLKGKRITYGEGTGRQPFVLSALKTAGLSTKDVKLVPLRAADFPDAIRSGQVDVAVLNEPHFTRYVTDFKAQGTVELSEEQYAQLPSNISYLYASPKALADPAKTAAIGDFVRHWIAANDWSERDPDAWVKAYYVEKQHLGEQDGRAIVEADGAASYPLLKDLIAPQQATIDLIYGAGDIPKRLDANEEFDLRFDPIIAQAVQGLGNPAAAPAAAAR